MFSLILQFVPHSHSTLGGGSDDGGADAADGGGGADDDDGCADDDDGGAHQDKCQLVAILEKYSVPTKCQEDEFSPPLPIMMNIYLVQIYNSFN